MTNQLAQRGHIKGYTEMHRPPILISPIKRVDHENISLGPPANNFICLC